MSPPSLALYSALQSCETEEKEAEGIMLRSAASKAMWLAKGAALF